jgi:hypothetical protein
MPSLRCLLLASGVLVLGRSAGAQSASEAHRELRLSWVRSASAASCPDAGHVEADVEQRLGWSPFVQNSDTSQSIEASVTHDNDVWRAAIELRAPDGASLGSRNVESPAATCASLAAAAGLAIALMIEPLLPEKPVPPPAPPPAPPKPAVLVATPSTTELTVITPTQDRGAANGSLGLGALAAAGVLPRVALGVTMIASARLVDRLFGAASVSFLPEQRFSQADGDVGFGMTLGSLGPCYRIPIHEGWSVSSCVSVLVGSLEVTVTKPDPVAPGPHFWWAASTGLRLGWKAGPFEAAFAIDALAHLTRHNYLIEHTAFATSSFIEPAFAGMGSLVAGVHY